LICDKDNRDREERGCRPVSDCGAPGEGGAPYVAPGERAKAAVKTNPEKSDRQIAEEIGTSPTTVGKACKQLYSDGQLKVDI
jgi:hypothetical protein